MEKVFFIYGEEEIDYLRKADRKLKEVIEEVGYIEREMIPEFFTALVNSIISQQISGKAQASIWKRFTEAVSPLTPENVCATSFQRLKKCGLSERKVRYIQFAAEQISQEKLDIKEFTSLSDGEIIKRLIILPGIGRWTAEMLLIFAMGRKDILSFDDFGIRKGICAVYGLEQLTKKEFKEYQQKFSPYGTIAGFYFWHVANNI